MISVWGIEHGEEIGKAFGGSRVAGAFTRAFSHKPDIGMSQVAGFHNQTAFHQGQVASMTRGAKSRTAASNAKTAELQGGIASGQAAAARKRVTRNRVGVAGLGVAGAGGGGYFAGQKKR